MKPTLLVMAAGMGTRYGGLKQIDPVGPNGEIIIDYSIYDALHAGFGKIVFVIRHDFEAAFKEKIGSKFDGVLPVEYAYQDLEACINGFQIPEGREKPWGTGQAVLVAEEMINEPFAVINADDYYGQHAFEVIAEFLATHERVESNEFCMVGYTLRNTLSDYGHVSRGVCHVDENGFLDAIHERKRVERIGQGARYIDPEGVIHDLTGDEVVSMNLWGFQPTIFPYLHRQFQHFLQTQGSELKSEFYIPTAVGELVDEKIASAKVLMTQGSWFGITYREDKENAVRSINRLIADGVYPEKLWEENKAWV